MKTSVVRMSLLFVLLLLAGCAPTSSGPRVKAVEPPKPVQPAAPPPQAGTVVLALPLGNAYGPFASKVEAGARAGVKRLAQLGVRMELIVVDTAQANWVEAVARTPASAVVGGPMIAQDLPALLAVNPRRAVFALLPEMGDSGAQEGTAAWRFFTSPRDHVRVVLTAAREQFGVRDVGVLFPQEAFGQRRAQLFGDMARSMGFTLKASGSYTPNDPLRWNKQVGDFLEAGYAAAGGQPGMQAVFLPDVWNQAQMLAPQFAYYQEDHMLLLGSALWSQTLDMKPEDSQAFRLALFPGAWHDGNAAPEAKALRTQLGGTPDFWHALGFDFVRLAAHLGPVPAPASPAWVNQRLRAAQHMPWAMAPMSWDAQGMGSQHLFLLSPAPGGPVLADIPALASRYKDAQQRRLQRGLGKP